MGKSQDGPQSRLEDVGKKAELCYLIQSSGNVCKKNSCPVHNELNTKPWRGTGKMMYGSMYSWPRLYLVSDQLYAPVTLPRETALDTHSIGSWMGPRTVLDDDQTRKILPSPTLEIRTLGLSARSQSLRGSESIEIRRYGTLLWAHIPVPCSFSWTQMSTVPLLFGVSKGWLSPTCISQWFAAGCSTKNLLFRGSVVGWGTMLQARRSRVRFPMRSLDCSLHIIIPAPIRSWSRLSF
jgi:hypothetical protein